MSFDKKDVKKGIDTAAQKLKDATDVVAKSADQASAKAKEYANKTGDAMIAQGKNLKKAAR
jgi:hypothetical protein